MSCVAINEQDVNVPGNTFVTVAGWSFNITSPGVINNDIKILSVKKTINGGILIVDRLVKPPASNLFNSNVSILLLFRGITMHAWRVGHCKKPKNI